MAHNVHLFTHDWVIDNFAALYHENTPDDFFLKTRCFLDDMHARLQFDNQKNKENSPQKCILIQVQCLRYKEFHCKLVVKVGEEIIYTNESDSHCKNGKRGHVFFTNLKRLDGLFIRNSDKCQSKVYLHFEGKAKTATLSQPLKNVSTFFDAKLPETVFFECIWVIKEFSSLLDGKHAFNEAKDDCIESPEFCHKMLPECKFIFRLYTQRIHIEPENYLSLVLLDSAESLSKLPSIVSCEIEAFPASSFTIWNIENEKENFILNSKYFFKNIIEKKNLKNGSLRIKCNIRIIVDNEFLTFVNSKIKRDEAKVLKLNYLRLLRYSKGDKNPLSEFYHSVEHTTNVLKKDLGNNTNKIPSKVNGNESQIGKLIEHIEKVVSKASTVQEITLNVFNTTIVHLQEVQNVLVNAHGNAKIGDIEFSSNVKKQSEVLQRDNRIEAIKGCIQKVQSDVSGLKKNYLELLKEITLTNYALQMLIDDKTIKQEAGLEEEVDLMVDQSNAVTIPTLASTNSSFQWFWLLVVIIAAYFINYINYILK